MLRHEKQSFVVCAHKSPESLGEREIRQALPRESLKLFLKNYATEKGKSQLAAGSNRVIEGSKGNATLGHAKKAARPSINDTAEWSLQGFMLQNSSPLRCLQGVNTLSC